MKVLVIDEEIPYPLNTGKRIRTYNFLKHLSTRHKITFLCRLHEDMDIEGRHALEELGIRVVIVSHPIRKKSGFLFYWALLRNLVSIYPYVVTSHYSEMLVARIGSMLSHEQFDIIHCEWTPYAQNLKQFLPAQSVLVAHNIESLIWHRLYKIENNLCKKVFMYLQWKKMEKYEKQIFPLFKKIIVVSENDKAKANEWIPEKQIQVVENGVDIKYFNPQDTTEIPYSLVFTGSLDWRPNEDGMLFFLENIWSHVIHQYPDSSLTIVGRRPSKSLKDCVSKLSSVELTGLVEDVRPYINKASVYIVPLRVGGGSRLKILEALAMKKPVVSTSIGAEGLNVIPDKDLIIADDPIIFADAIRRLFENSRLRNQLGLNGQNLVTTKYTWQQLSKKLEKAWYDAMNDSF